MKLVLRVLLLLVGSTAIGLAQQTGLTGKVTDATGAVIPKASVEVKQAGAGTFTTKSNNEGTWLLPSLTASDYVVTVSAPGFTTTQTRVSILVGQTLEVNSTMPAGGSSDSVVVTSDQTAVDTTSSTVAGNITPNDVKDMPINGRNYMELATLVPGIRVNAITNDTPLGNNNSGKFQINLDGLQVTQDTADPSFGQPRFSPDAITQFQIITNRFDATLGRSSGVYVNVQSKTGGNDIHGSVFGYFRNDAFNAADPIARQVTALSDQQFGGTFGGPIRRGKMWYFGSYEGEHQASSVPDTPVATNVTLVAPQTLKVNEYLGRGDWQPSTKDHIFVRGNGFTFKNDNVVASGSTDPSSFYYATRMNYAVLGGWERQISSKVVSDLHIGFNHFQWQNLPLYPTLAITFAGVTRPDGTAGGTATVGGPYNYPQIFYQNVQQYRDDLFYLTGKHSFKFGAEYLHTAHTGYFQQNVRGAVGSANCGVVNYKLAFPNGTTDPTTWNYTELNRACATATLTQGSGNFNVDIPRNGIGFWAQDDWKVLPRLTLNLGVRYDNDLGAFAPGLQLNNGLLTPKSGDNNNFAPRLGFVYDVAGNGKTVIRGGAGMFYADISANQTIDMQIFNGVTSKQYSVTGSASAPLNLQNPFPASALLPRQAVQPLGPNVATPYSLQISGGVQRELPLKAVLTADFVHTRTYHDWVRLNANLLQNPSNPQFNLSPSTRYAAGTSVVCPNGGVTPDTTFTAGSSFNVCAQAFTNVNQFFTPNDAGAIYDALQLGIRQAPAHGVTSGVAYTYSRYKNSSESPFYYPNKPFVNGVHDEWANAQDDQRQTLTVNGNYAWKYGLSLSGLFHYGSGNAFPTAVGTTQPTGYAPSYNRTFAAGVTPIAVGATCPASPCVTVYNDPTNNYQDSSGYYITKRDAFYGRGVYRADSRLQERLKLGDHYAIVVAAEAFNLFNHSNFGNYNTTVTSPSYGTPLQTTSAATGVPVEWRPRSLQFLGRFEF